MERYGGGQIVVVAYNPEWPAMFEQEREKLVAVLGSLVVAIEHMGSTAVPGLAAKPIIDLLVGVRSLANTRSRCIEPLQLLGYSYISDYKSELPEELFFRKGTPGPWTHHLHIMEPANPRNRWNAFLLFRNYLRAHPERVRAYAELKQAAARMAGEDIAAYREAKHAFVEAAVTEARAERLLPHHPHERGDDRCYNSK
jgi:GrpB-like predicted nucleotidyltransferase (UPF0157 family)